MREELRSFVSETVSEIYKYHAMDYVTLSKQTRATSLPPKRLEVARIARSGSNRG